MKYLAFFYIIYWVWSALAKRRRAETKRNAAQRPNQEIAKQHDYFGETNDSALAAEPAVFTQNNVREFGVNFVDDTKVYSFSEARGSASRRSRVSDTPTRATELVIDNDRTYQRLGDDLDTNFVQIEKNDGKIDETRTDHFRLNRGMRDKFNVAAMSEHERDSYEHVDAKVKPISFNFADMRTYFVMQEILGLPASLKRRRHR